MPSKMAQVKEEVRYVTATGSSTAALLSRGPTNSCKYGELSTEHNSKAFTA